MSVHAGSHEGVILGTQHRAEKVVVSNRVRCLGMLERLI